MATAHVTIGKPMQNQAPIFKPGNYQALASGSTSTLEAGVSMCARVVPVGGAMLVAVGQSPATGANETAYCPEGSINYFSMSPGDKVAVTDA